MVQYACIPKGCYFVSGDPAKDIQKRIGSPDLFHLRVYNKTQQHDKVLSVQHHHILCSGFLGGIFIRSEVLYSRLRAFLNLFQDGFKHRSNIVATVVSERVFVKVRLQILRAN
jgi:hypothetical protein